MGNSLYQVLREYDMRVAYDNLQMPFSSLTLGEDMIIRSFGQKIVDKKLRYAIRHGELSDLLSSSHDVSLSELRLVLGENLLCETWESRAKYLDSRIREHPTRKPLRSC